jgi:hypothetical protein
MHVALPFKILYMKQVFLFAVFLVGVAITSIGQPGAVQSLISIAMAPSSGTALLKQCSRANAETGFQFLDGYPN